MNYLNQLNNFNNRNSSMELLSTIGIALCIFIFMFGPVIFVLGELFEYTVWQCFAKDLPWYIDYTVGTIIAPVTFTASIVAWVMEACGWTAPYFGG